MMKMRVVVLGVVMPSRKRILLLLLLLLLQLHGLTLLKPRCSVRKQVDVTAHAVWTAPIASAISIRGEIRVEVIRVASKRMRR